MGSPIGVCSTKRTPTGGSDWPTFWNPAPFLFLGPSILCVGPPAPFFLNHVILPIGFFLDLVPLLSCAVFLSFVPDSWFLTTFFLKPLFPLSGFFSLVGPQNHYLKASLHIHLSFYRSPHQEGPLWCS